MEYIGFVEMAEDEWLTDYGKEIFSDPIQRDEYYWPWFYFLLAAVWGEI